MKAETRNRPISDVFAHRLAHALGVEVKDIASPSDEDDAETEALAS